MPAATRRRPRPSSPEAGESQEEESSESPEEQLREGSEDMPPTAKGRKRGRTKRTVAVKDAPCSCHGKKDGDTSAGPGELYNPSRKNPRMTNDALTPQEYLDACDLGIQNESKAYIRARLDATTAINQQKSGSSLGHKIATGAAIAGGVAGAAYGLKHRRGIGSAVSRVASRARTSAGGHMRAAGVRAGYASHGLQQRASGMASRARSGMSSTASRARTNMTNTAARTRSSFATARRSVGNTVSRVRGKSPKQLSFNLGDSVWADGFNIDSATFDGLLREDIKCGNGAISKGEKCHKGAGGSAGNHRANYGIMPLTGENSRMSRKRIAREGYYGSVIGGDPFSYKQQAKRSAVFNGVAGAAMGAFAGSHSHGVGGGIAGGLIGGAALGALGAGAGALQAGINRSTSRAAKRSLAYGKLEKPIAEQYNKKRKKMKEYEMRTAMKLAKANDKVYGNPMSYGV